MSQLRQFARQFARQSAEADSSRLGTPAGNSPCARREEQLDDSGVRCSDSYVQRRPAGPVPACDVFVRPHLEQLKRETTGQRRKTRLRSRVASADHKARARADTVPRETPTSNSAR